MYNQKQIENISATPLYFIGYGRKILFFVLNCFLLYSVANALADLNSISVGRVYGSLIVGSLFGISYPIIVAKSKGDNSFEAQFLRVVVVAGIIFIQGFVLSDTIYLFSQGVDDIGNLKYAIFNIIVGMIVDFTVGSEFSSYVRNKNEEEKQENKSKIEVSESKDKPTSLVPVKKNQS